MNEILRLSQTCSAADVSEFVKLVLDRDFARFNIAIQHGIILGIKEFETKRNCWHELSLACRNLDYKTKTGKMLTSGFGGEIFRKLCFDNRLDRMSASERKAFDVWLTNRDYWKPVDYEWLQELVSLGQLQKEALEVTAFGCAQSVKRREGEEVTNG